MAATISMNDFHAPDLVTKNLKLNAVKGRKRVRVSSNFLPLVCGFGPEDRLAAVPSFDGGFNLIKSDSGPYKVHTRRYPRARSNNPFETVIELSTTELIRSLGGATERFRVEMRKSGEMKIRPLPNRAFGIIQRYKNTPNPLTAMVALTGGIDAHCMSKLGFKPEVIVEWRPPEARDYTGGRFRDLSEVHALSAARNVQPRAILNEDLYQLDPVKLREVCDEKDGIVCAHYSLCCQDFSTLKSAEDKAASISTKNDTTIDQVYVALRQIEECRFPVVVVENVAPFERSQAGQIFMSMLRRFGYHLTPMKLQALDHGGIQGRKRFYLVASVFPGGIKEPEPIPRNPTSIWPIVEKHLSDCRDVTHASFVKKRSTSNRQVPMITRESTSCSTIIKSQSRGVKDSLLISDGDRVLAPSEGLIRELMSIDPSFDVSWCAAEQAIETLGQSVDGALHESVMQSVKDHILLNLGQASQQKIRRQARLF